MSIVGANPFAEPVEAIQLDPSMRSARLIASNIAAGAIAMLPILPFSNLSSTSSIDQAIVRILRPWLLPHHFQRCALPVMGKCACRSTAYNVLPFELQR